MKVNEVIMITTKTKATSKPKVNEAMGAALLVAVQQAVKDLGVAGRPAAPRVIPTLEAVNSPYTAALIEYAVTKAIQDAAKERHAEARDAVRKLFRGELPHNVCRKQVVYQDAFATLNAQVNNGSTKIDKDRLEMELADTFQMSQPEIKSFMERVSRSDKPALMLEVVLKA